MQNTLQEMFVNRILVSTVTAVLPFQATHVHVSMVTLGIIAKVGK